MQQWEWQDWAELWLCVKKFSDRLTLPTLLKTRVEVLTVVQLDGESVTSLMGGHKTMACLSGKGHGKQI